MTVGDHRVRHTHAQMHGNIRPIGDAYWRTHWPPNGFDCPCHVQVVSVAMMRRAGWVETAPDDPALQVPAYAGWSVPR